MIKQRKMIILVICLVITIALVVIQKPSIKKYENDFGFSIENVDVKTIDYFHHDDFRDSLSIYRLAVSGDIDGSIFEVDKMNKGLSSEAKDMYSYAIESTCNQKNFKDLATVDLYTFKSIVLNSKEGSDARFCILYNETTSSYFAIWVG